MKTLLEYLNSNLINYTEKEGIITIDNKTYELIKANKDNMLFDEKFHLIAEETKQNAYVFEFGEKYYHLDKGKEQSVELNELKYLGKAKQELSTKTFLGVRGGYELLNGSRLYKDWCNKAKFLGTKTLGICEKNTLAGTLKFQLECKKNEIKSILGATYTVWREAEDYRYDIKCYVKNEKGWENLLLINKEVLVTNSKFIKETDLFKLTEGLFIVFDPKSIEFDKVFPWDITKEDHYYQLDTVEFTDNEHDKWYLENLKKFYHSKMKPVSTTDAFYLDKEDYHIKQKLNSIGGFQEYISKNQYFKNKDDYFFELQELFNEDDFDSLVKTLDEATQNESWIASQCNFEIETGKRHLPKYRMTEEEKRDFKTNEDLFWYLVERGLRKKTDESKYDFYLERIEKEFSVIEKGGVLDYFLITRDIINWAENQGILQGVARGSAGGSLIMYLLGIIKINPLDFDLLFERFINEGRITVSLPDVDSDFPTHAREDVKHYIEQRFGVDQVCSVGTYTTLKLKGAIKDLTRLERNHEFMEVNMVTKFISDDDKKIEDLFKLAVSNRTVKDFIEKYPNVINDLTLLLNQPKAKSIHACAMMIFPKEKDMYRWSPMRIQDGMIVSEFEGGELDESGFLKEDILGIMQLSKFTDILKLVKDNHNKDIDIYNLPLDDTEVYRYFKNGWNGDVFHFGSHGLTGYCQEMKPENINELIAAISLYRPGAMENNFHNEYISRKEGKKESVAYIGAEEILKDTFSIFVYQEQVMKMCQVLGGMSLVEADDIRKAMGKKKLEILHGYRDQFVKYYIENFEVEEEYADNVWGEMEKASTYLFNKSHAAAYTVTGYISQWLKVHYPTEYWTIALNYANDKEVADYISEINKTGKIRVLPPDINISETTTKTDFESQIIYWALGNVKGLGDVATTQIMADKEKNGEYFSFEEFIDRHTFTGSKVNKTHYENLVISGAFDKIEKIKTQKDRLKLIERFREIKKVKIKDSDKDILRDNKEKLGYNWWWNLQQKRLSGLAFFDYHTLYKNYSESQKKYPYVDFVRFNEEKVADDRKKVSIGGYVVDVEVRQSNKGDYARITLENNYDFYTVTVWAEQYEHFEDILLEAKGCLMLVNGNVVFDNYKKMNTLQTNDDSVIIILE